ncbi:MAG: beta-ketoacyl-ACP synthase III, partial [Eubacteriales bacterium]
VGIVGTGIYLPEKVLTNADIEKIVDTTDEWIRNRTGIQERRIISDDMATSDIAVRAAKMALQNAGVSAEEVDLIIVATISPDMFFPATACLVQKDIGAWNAAAFDLSAGCTGFVYGLAVGSQFIKTGMYKTVLLVGAESLSRSINWEDRNTCVLFGDAAGAVVLRQVEDGFGILSVELGADGSGHDLLKQAVQRTQAPGTEGNCRSAENYLTMAGREVFKFAVKIVGETALKAIESAGLQKNDIDCFIPHQANIRIIDAAAKRLDLPKDKVFVNVQKYGNTSAASIPVALHEAFLEGKIKKGEKVVLVGFGAGLTWGASVIKWAL